MKKKIMALALTVALLALVVGGSLAWFTDEDQATNTFTVGSIKIVQHETNEDGTDFTQEQVMMPVVDMENPSADENYIYKIVTVENTGNNPAYIRTHIAVPTKLNNCLVLDIAGENWTWEFNSPYVDESGLEYTVYTFRYNDALASKAVTDALLNGVYLKANVDVKDNPDTESANLEFCIWNEETKAYEFTGFEIADAEGKLLTTIDILVATQAVQSEGFADAASALSATFQTTLPDFAG
ncbi:MAG: SipW-dependent-type signal peptide-containing protein [Oscillospiraceae bacterium]|nr:SipW-dependent-type signal peptide-containing protein [Oscillospiraceae bacterium]